MDVGALLLELYGRIAPLADEAVAGLDRGALTRPPTSDANPIGWLVFRRPTAVGGAGPWVERSLII